MTGKEKECTLREEYTRLQWWCSKRYFHIQPRDTSQSVGGEGTGRKSSGGGSCDMPRRLSMKTVSAAATQNMVVYWKQYSDGLHVAVFEDARTPKRQESCLLLHCLLCLCWYHNTSPAWFSMASCLAGQKRLIQLLCGHTGELPHWPSSLAQNSCKGVFFASLLRQLYLEISV